MKKATEVQPPYIINADISLEGLKGLPPDTAASEIFLSLCIQGVNSYAEPTKGITSREQRMLWNIRDAFEKAQAVKETSKIEISSDDFKFILKCWENQRTQVGVNELFHRISEQFKLAQSDHDKAKDKKDGKVIDIKKQ